MIAARFQRLALFQAGTIGCILIISITAILKLFIGLDVQKSMPQLNEPLYMRFVLTPV
jgi:hypothetical protein